MGGDEPQTGLVLGDRLIVFVLRLHYDDFGDRLLNLETSSQSPPP